MRTRFLNGIVAAALVTGFVACGTDDRAVPTSEAGKADRSIDKLIVGSWTATGKARFANALTFSADKKFSGNGGCPQDGRGPHCFLIFPEVGTWETEKKGNQGILDMTFTVVEGGSGKQTRQYLVFTKEAHLTLVALTGNPDKDKDVSKLTHYSFVEQTQSVAECTKDEECKDTPLTFFCPGGGAASHVCQNSVCTGKCAPLPHGGGGVLPVRRECTAIKVGTESATCMPEHLVLVDGCRLGTIDQTATCAKTGDVCCVPQTQTHGKQCDKDADCKNPKFFCLKPVIEFGSFLPEGVAPVNPDKFKGQCVPKGRV
jgi:hypothetical protein